MWRNHLSQIRFQFQQDKLLKDLSTFKIGGPAKYFTESSTIEQMQALLEHCREVSLPYIVVGKGSNSLFDDRGFNGLVIQSKIAFCNYEESIVSVGSGYSFSLLGVQTARKGWAGLEFASGIPGSVGGAIYMNAGANGAETKDSLCEVTYLTEGGDLQVLPKEALSFSYRSSSFQNKRGVILAGKFQLTPSSEARQKQLKIVDYRTRTQPYSDPSVGCIFRNPSLSPAGALIEQSGLKGLSVGGAQVSTLHANFIINTGNASAQDVLTLSDIIRAKVKEKTGVDLELELRYIPYTP